VLSQPFHDPLDMGPSRPYEHLPRDSTNNAGIAAVPEPRATPRSEQTSPPTPEAHNTGNTSGMMEIWWPYENKAAPHVHAIEDEWFYILG
jgi:hypothetical protein